MKLLRSLWDRVKPQAIKELVAKEPAISAGVGAIAASVAAHYGLHLSAAQETWVASGALFLLNWIVRQVVTPSSDTAKEARRRKA